MVSTASTAFALAPLTQDSTQAHSYPLIQRWKGSFMTVFEVSEPARQRLVHRLNDYSHAVPMSASRFIPNRRFQFGHTLSSRPAIATLKVIAQKVKATTLRGVHDAGLFRMQLQTSSSRPRLPFCDRCAAFGFPPPEHHTLPPIPPHLLSPPPH